VNKQFIISRKWKLHLENFALFCTPLVAKVSFLFLMVMVIVILNIGIGTSSSGTVVLVQGNPDTAIQVVSAVFTVFAVVAYAYWWFKLWGYVNKKTKENNLELKTIRAREKGVLIEKN